jgi:hypothetical protein
VDTAAGQAGTYASPVDTALAPPATSTTVVRGLDLGAKAGLVVLLVAALLRPDLGNMEDKAAGLRAVGYPLVAFTLPAIWMAGRGRFAFPWLADLLITATCFTDILGNRLDLYDSVVWFDDWMHFMNTGLLTAAVLLVTLPDTAPLSALVERALAFGATAAVAWEIAEYFAFLNLSPERVNAYDDTLGDLGLGILGAVLAALLVHSHRRRTPSRPVTAPRVESTLPRPVD